MPVLLTEMDCVPPLPTITLPKLTLVGLIASCPIGAATPEPLRVTEVGLLEALLTNATCPEALPVVLGANCAV